MSKITDKAMQAKPDTKDAWLQEPFARGAGVFVARITSAGERLFYFRYTDSTGKRPYLKLGAYSQRGGAAGLTVEQARALARERSDLYQSGVKDLHAHFDTQAAAANVSAAVEKHKSEAELRRLTEEAAREAAERERRISVRTLFTQWQATDLRPHIGANGKRLGRKDKGAYTSDQFERRVFPAIGDRPACEISKADVLMILDAVKAEGKLRTANVLLTDLKQMFRFAEIRELVEKNPLSLLDKRKVGGESVERDRYLSAEEISALAKALPEARMSERSQAGLWIILSTGVRVGELMGAVWGRPSNTQELQTLAEEADAKLGFVDLEARSWYLPTTKNQRDHTIHLSDFAVARFKQLETLRETGPWAFPNTAGTGPVCVKSFGKQIADRQRDAAPMKNRTAASKALQLPGGRWTAHDLRRTAATLMAKLGVSSDVIDECLNHKIAGKSTRVYVHDRRLEAQAEAFNLLGRRLAVLVPTLAPPV